MVPAAPPRLSTTICCPSAADHDWPTRRAVASTDSPAGKGTTSRMGLAGEGCASAAAETSSSARHEDVRTICSPLAQYSGLPALPSLRSTLDRLYVSAGEINRGPHRDGIADVIRERRLGPLPESLLGDQPVSRELQDILAVDVSESRE